MIRRLGRLIAGLALLALAAACATEMSMGSAPNTDALDRLTIGETTRVEITRIVGAPRGRGEARFNLDQLPREIMFYELIETHGATVNVRMLIILLRDGRYDGHLWFSGAEILDPAKL